MVGKIEPLLGHRDFTQYPTKTIKYSSVRRTSSPGTLDPLSSIEEWDFLLQFSSRNSYARHLNHWWQHDSFRFLYNPLMEFHVTSEISTQFLSVVFPILGPGISFCWYAQFQGSRKYTVPPKKSLFLHKLFISNIALTKPLHMNGSLHNSHLIIRLNRSDTSKALPLTVLLF